MMRTLSKGLRKAVRLVPILIIVAAFSLVAFGLKNLLYADSFFQVEKISVFPANILTDPECRYLEAQVRGRSIFELSLHALAHHLEQNPLVKQAEVSRDLPSQLKIYLTPRTPFVQIRMDPRGPCYVVSEDQVVMTKVPAPQKGLLMVEHIGARKRTYLPGMRYEHLFFYEWADILKWIKESAVLKGQSVSKLTVDEAGHFTVVLSDGIELRIGRKSSFDPNQMAVLTALLHSGERQDILYVDFRYQDVIVKKKV